MPRWTSERAPAPDGTPRTGTSTDGRASTASSAGAAPGRLKRHPSLPRERSLRTEDERMSLRGLETALLMPQRPVASRCTAPRARRCSALSHGNDRVSAVLDDHRRVCGPWKLPVLTVASALVLASCVGSGQPMGERSLTLTSTEASETQSAPETRPAEPVAQIGAMHPPAVDPTAGLAARFCINRACSRVKTPS